jgi:hypothetical protein
MHNARVYISKKQLITHFKRLGFFPVIHIFGKKIYVIRGGEKKPHKIKKYL